MSWHVIKETGYPKNSDSWNEKFLVSTGEDVIEATVFYHNDGTPYFAAEVPKARWMEDGFIPVQDAVAWMPWPEKYQ